MRVVAPFATTAAMAVVASAAPASSAVTLPLSSSSNVQSMEGLVRSGKARLQHYNDASNGQEDVTTGSSPVTNELVTYLANVTIGGSDFSLIVDTGSSNLWCGAQKTCEPSSTGKSTGKQFKVTYGSGSVVGTEYTDTVSFAGLTVTSQSLGAAKKSSGFGSDIDGILGFGPVDLTAKTVKGVSVVPTFMDNLYKQKSISSEVLGVYFAPLSGSESSASNGELTLGGVDSTKYTGSITYISQLTSGLASKYWGLQVTGLKVGSTSVSMSAADAIVDTGTTLIYLPPAAYKGIIKATGGTADEGIISFTKMPTATITIELGGNSFALTPSQYLVPTAEYGELKLTKGKYYAWFAEGGDSGLEGIIGQKFLENYYSVFDTTQKRIGFASHA